MADTKVSAMTEETSPATDDLLYLVKSGGGDRKVTVTNLRGSGSSGPTLTSSVTDGSGATSTSSTSFVDAGPTLTVPATAGDVILVTVTGHGYTGGSTLQMAQTLNFGATTGDVRGTSPITRILVDGNRNPVGVQWVYTAVSGDISGGNVTVKFRFAAPSGSTIYLANDVYGVSVMTAINFGH